MTTPTTTASTAFARRSIPVAGLDAEADRLAAACRDMAGRFRDGGRLVAAGRGLSAADVAHVVVEFVHPVIVGTRALPALALPGGGSAATVELFGEPGDVLLALSTDGADAGLAAALEAGVRAGMLTIALLGDGDGGDGGPMARVDGVDHVIVVHSPDPRIVREAHVTAYHVLWELVHVFLAESS